MPSPLAMLRVLRHIQRELAGDVSLDALARRAGWSPFHFHRAFQRTVGETPKRYTERLRLERAAGQLAATATSIIGVALDAGFSSPEVFARAFRRQFGRTPSQHRAAVAAHPLPVWHRHRELTAAVGPCVRLFHITDTVPGAAMMNTISIAREERAAQPMLFVRRRVARTDIAAALAECFGKVYMHCQQAGLPLAGRPTARYYVNGPGLLVIEAGTPLAAPAQGIGEIEAGELPAGPVAVAVHAGPYDALPATHAAIEQWIEQQGLEAAGAPWESYTTDPAEHPDPADWRTEVCWPLAR